MELGSGGGNGDSGRLGFGAGKPVGHGSEREEGAGGRADKVHAKRGSPARVPRMAGGDACGAGEGNRERERGGG